MNLFGTFKIAAGGVSGDFDFNFVSASANGTAIDCSGFKSLCVVIMLSEPIESNFPTGEGNIFLEGSDDNVSWTNVPDADVINRAASAPAGQIGKYSSLFTRRQIVMGVALRYRYYRVRWARTSGTTTTGGAIAVYGLLGHARQEPVAHSTW